MTHIRFETQLSLPPALAFKTLAQLLAEIGSQEGAWEGFPLHVDLGDAGLPDVGYVGIPIAVHPDVAKHDELAMEITIRAARHSESFPTFAGKVGVDATGPTGAALWIAGTYHVPLHGIGRLVDATLFRNIAQKALQNLLGDISEACRARIEKSEARYARYRMFDRST